jgi:adenylosuccinate lyase
MIARYQTPEMAALWSEESRYQTWALVEAYALEAWEALGQVPRGLSQRLLKKIQEKPLTEAFARMVAELEASTRHDIVAFTRALVAWTEDEEVGRYLHLGLTSSDVVDTAQNALLSRALDLVLAELEEVEEALKALALRYRRTPRHRPHPRGPRRAHGLRPPLLKLLRRLPAGPKAA